MRSLLLVAIIFCSSLVQAQRSGYWQQKADYSIKVDFDHKKHQFKGTEEITYTNNSPDTLKKIYFHLYYNAFQPGSMMDVRSRTISDPDPRVRSRIWKLKRDQQGYQKVTNLKCDGKKMKFFTNGTILEAEWPKGLVPGKTVEITMDVDAQVPVQIRRTGRMNKEGVEYSMSQWYPKVAEYDHEGWHANPYIGREFHGVWGNFNVDITMDAKYVVAATGYLQNPEQCGHGYQFTGQLKRPSDGKIRWKFKADNVHDFVWTADPDYKHDIKKTKDGIDIHFFYQKDTLLKQWDSLQNYAVRTMEIMNQMVGKYPYKKYSVIQGGDGGMEYPMATLITGHSRMSGLISVTVHEMIHSWFQGALATNESIFPWMDEGFTTWAQYHVLFQLYNKKPINPLTRSYGSYFRLAKSGRQEPLTTHADHYISNGIYGASSYSKGAVFLHQLSYVMGHDEFMKGLKRYFSLWKFKHPTASDFKRVMEKSSGLELDWYFEHWVGTTNKIDYSIKAVTGNSHSTKVIISREEDMPMPIDLRITYTDSTSEWLTIPLRIMRGSKSEEKGRKYVQLTDWPWTHPYYELDLDTGVDKILKIEIDPTTRLADINGADNSYPFSKSKTQEAQYLKKK